MIEMSIVLWMIGGLLGVLAAMFAWGVSQMQSKVDGVAKQLEKINATLIGIERDMRGELAGLDRRVSQLQIAIRSLHPEYHGLDSQ